MAKSIAGAFKAFKTDELYTPKILVEAITPYFEKWLETTGKEEITVWCPFDMENSEFVHFFNQFEDVNVIYSHFANNLDFFSYEPDYWDIAISNPPFSRKLDVFKRLNELGKPWVMLSNIMCLNYMEIGKYFADNPVQLLIPDKRISFDGNPSSFCSGYFCKDFLPSDLLFCHLEHCNSGKNYEESRMHLDVLNY